jgi:methionine-rich copper-binding protein CopC
VDPDGQMPVAPTPVRNRRQRSGVTLTIGSMINCRTRTNVPTKKAFTVVANIAPIIAPFGIFMTMPMDIRGTVIIRSLAIMATATAIGVGSGASQREKVFQSYAQGETKMSRNTIAIAVLAILAMGALATSAEAHPKLKSVSPAADVSSKVSPKEIKLNFSEGVIAKFSGLELKDEAGKIITTGVPVNDPGDRKQLVVPLPSPLIAGRYKVAWHAVSEDTHRVKGEYSFEVAP